MHKETAENAKRNILDLLPLDIYELRQKTRRKTNNILMFQKVNNL